MEKLSEGKAVGLRRHHSKDVFSVCQAKLRIMKPREHWSSYLSHRRQWQSPDHVEMGDKAIAWPHLCSDTLGSK